MELPRRNGLMQQRNAAGPRLSQAFRCGVSGNQQRWQRGPENSAHLAYRISAGLLITQSKIADHDLNRPAGQPLHSYWSMRGYGPPGATWSC
ncbi:hypothetical protein D3C76_1384190 [compost metagenome]